MTDEIVGNYILTKARKPCIVCGKLTNRLEYCYEAYLCSDECQDVIDTKVAKMEEECKDIPL